MSPVPARKVHGWLAGLLVVALATGALGAPAPATADTGGSPAAATRTYPLAERLAREVTGARVREHLAAFQAIADANGGNRGYNRPGSARSADYLVSRLEQAGYQVTRQQVPYTDFEITAERLTVGAPVDAPVTVMMTNFTPSTGADGIDAPLAALAPGHDGCAPADHAGVAGRVLVVARAACGYTQQQRLAAEAGARAVIVYHPTPSPDNRYRFTAVDPTRFVIPVGSVSERDGLRLIEAARRGDVPARLTLTGRTVPAVTENVVAETPDGDPHDVVLVGGHLDSVPEAPGINDNATTAATVLQIALAVAEQPYRPRNRLRFVWWGAEELIDVGSKAYVDRLDAGARADIAALVNGELLGSENFVRFVWDSGTGGDHVLASLFTSWLDRQGLPYEIMHPAMIGSDHEPFQRIGVPVGGMTGGSIGVKTAAQQAVYGGHAGQLYDRCYPQACDDLAHLDQFALDTSVPAYAWVVGRLATEVADVRAASGR
ncbi:MAG TPA: M28 family peptidase [Micromonospora sp.]